MRCHLVHWLTTKVHEITTERAKGIKEFILLQIGKGSEKGVPDGAVESRISLVEEPSGSRRGLAHEQDSHTIWTITLS